MAEMLTGLFAGTVALVLLTAFIGHVRSPHALPAALAAHRTLPGSLVRPVALAVAALEGLLGAATGFALLAGREHLLSYAAGGTAALMAGYALYGLYVLRTRPSVPCGCSAEGTPMSGWVAGRAGALALASLVAAGAHASAGGAHLAIAGLASVVFAVLLWALPLAMFDAERNPAG